MPQNPVFPIPVKPLLTISTEKGLDHLLIVPPRAIVGNGEYLLFAISKSDEAVERLWETMTVLQGAILTTQCTSSVDIGHLLFVADFGSSGCTN
jgi:hypothetical protein